MSAPKLTRNPNRGKRHATRLHQPDGVRAHKRKARTFTEQDLGRVLRWYAYQNGTLPQTPSDGAGFSAAPEVTHYMPASA